MPLAVVTAIALALSVITGLLGVNLAGIPDADDPLAFLILCLLPLLVALAQPWLRHRNGWLLACARGRCRTDTP